MSKKACIFVRVSSTNDRQDYNRQIQDLKVYCERQGLTIIHTISEKISRAKKNEDREGISSVRLISPIRTIVALESSSFQRKHPSSTLSIQSGFSSPVIPL